MLWRQALERGAHRFLVRAYVTGTSLGRSGFGSQLELYSQQEIDRRPEARVP